MRDNKSDSKNIYLSLFSPVAEDGTSGFEPKVPGGVNGTAKAQVNAPGDTRQASSATALSKEKEKEREK